ncbi:MAG: bifunctional phosphoribosylaminoimidazolecarboxamide formyltransferase/IMP cyclohydrolase [Actinomycetota bacterium]
MRIRRALISVADKSGLDELARGLVDLGVSILSSGGTSRALARWGIPATSVSQATGAPEILDGRLKTIHPSIYGGILADRRRPQHMAQLKELGIAPIDLVVCNLYPFSSKVEAGVSEDEAVEHIDVGGPSMVRAGAKNYRSVAVVVSPERYPSILGELRARAGSLSDETRAKLAAEAFSYLAAYDIAVSRWLTRGERLPETALFALSKRMQLRYGENPHQAAAFYSERELGWRQLAGRELSYTNLLDLDAAWRLVGEFEEPAAAIIKHTNPSGCATGMGVEEAYLRALECDPRSAFGGVVAANRPIDGPTAARITKIMTEIVAAPSFTADALEELLQRKNLRAIEARPLTDGLFLRSAADGVLLQEGDDEADEPSAMSVVTRARPEEEDWRNLLFAWKVVRHVTSNGIVFASGGQALGIGAGQMSRVEAVELAARRAGERAKGCACASDGFFPFRDGVEAAVRAGARAIIQPGGSVRDPEVIAAADDLGIPMVLTGRRHFRH